MKIQPVRGTRDFYPDDMAFRNWLFERWRRASRRAGFVEVDGPVLEPLDLYTEKSGEEIVDQLYWLEDKGGRRLALRPEFTPTLARMFTARQAALPEPVRWFNISRCFRYERAQKGRLREFFQWNADVLGVADEIADAECIALAVDSLAETGLRPDDVEVRLSDRRLLGALVRHLGIADALVPQVFAVLDKRGKVPPEALEEMLTQAGLAPAQRDGLARILTWQGLADIEGHERATPEVACAIEGLERLLGYLEAYGVSEWCRFDIGIVRGLAYYTGPVWEVHDRKGEFRAVFGGGRYDRLLEDLGGKPMAACGFGCGDAVLGLLLQERGLKPAPDPAAEYFVASAGKANLLDVLAAVRHLRQRGLAAAFDPKGGSLKRQMKKAADAGARFVVIAGDAFAETRQVTLRDMGTGDQHDVALDDLGA
ncbi:MAG: histidine--tRNA ligase [Planctomycetes bacterium]|nr:histidine--tRNA ligase [Planctomycetota bacterium]